MLLIKILAYVMIVQGVIFSLLAIYVTIVVKDWLDIIIGLFILGPLSLASGILILKKIKSTINIDLKKKPKKKPKKK